MGDAALDRDTIDKEAVRAAEALRRAVDQVRSTAEASNSNGLKQTAANLRRAAESLGMVDQLDDSHASAALRASNAIVGDALALMRNSRSLPALAPTCVEDLEQSLSILKPIANMNGLPVTKPAVKASVPPPGEDNRRKFERAFLQSEVNFASDNNFYTGFSEDVSEGGLFIATYDLKPLGSHVDLEFTLPDGHVVKVDGVVRWVRDTVNAVDADHEPPGMGIQFDSLSEEDHEAITFFVEARAPLFYED